MGSAVISAAFLWYYRHLLARPTTAPPAPWRTYLRVQATALGLYGLGLLLAPALFSAFWP